MNSRSLSVIYVIIALGLFAHMPVWGWIMDGGAPMPESYEIAPEDFAEKMRSMSDAYATGEEESGIPVVHPPEGDIYLMAYKFGFEPVLELDAGKSYRLHVSSVDILHGLNFPLADADTLLSPGVARVMPLEPTESGRFAMICSENCGLDHNRMKGWVIVKDGK